MTRMMMSFFAAISILAFVPSICAAGDDGVKTNGTAGTDGSYEADRVHAGNR